MSDAYRPQLIMRRADWSNLSALALPDGYQLHRCDRAFSATEQEGIARVLGAAFPEMTWQADRVGATFVGDNTCRTTFYLKETSTREIVATATVREEASFPGAGYVHWVGVSPNQRGKRLGYCISLAVLHEFVRLGYHSAVLNTDDHRLAAIKIYLALGFVPLLAHGSHAERWQAIHKILYPA